MAKLDPAGHFRLESFIVSKNGKHVDLSALIHTFTIQESMGLNSIRGSAKFYDSTGILYDFPLIGEETIEIKYKDYFGQDRTDNMFLYAVSDMKPAKKADSNTLGLTLYFVGLDSFKANRRMVRKSYSGLISTMVGDLYDDYYSESDPINIETSTGFQRLSIPNMAPDDALNFLARRAYSSEDESSMFRFFQNRDGHFFTSPAYYANRFASNTHSFSYNSFADQTAEGQVKLMSQIIDIDFGEAVNTIGDLQEGKYNSSTIEVDILKREVSQNQYKYLDEYQEYKYPDGEDVSTRHTKEFMDESAIDPHVKVILKDYGDPDSSQYPSLRPSTFEHRSRNHKHAAAYHYNANAIRVKIYGRNDIVAGSKIYLDLVKFMKNQNEAQKDDAWSGTYFVESVNNIFYEHTYVQELTVSKYGVNAEPEAANTAEYVLDATNPDVDKPDISAFIVGPQ